MNKTLLEAQKLSIKLLYRKLKHIGVVPDMDLLEQKRILLLNELTMFICLLIFGDMIAMFAINSINAALVDIISILLVCIPILLNYLQKPETARWIFITFVLSIVTFFFIGFGKDFYQDYIYLLASVMIIIFFSATYKRFILLTILFILYFSVQYYFLSHPPLFDDQNADIAKYSTFILVIILTSFMLWLYIDTSSNIENQLKNSLYEIEEKNKKIEIDEFQIQQQNKSLGQVNKELEKFAYLVSNDLQNPLKDIQQSINIITDKLQTSTDRSINEYLNFTNSGVNRMQMIIQDVLEFSKLGDNEVELSTVDLRETITMVLININDVIQKRNAIVEISTMPVIQANPTQISLLFQNLIENGVKYNTSEIPFVVISYENDGIHHIINVKDNGIGINKANQKRIFEMFQRLKDKRDEEGSGIGLAICKKIVNQHHGTLNINSIEGKGSTLIIKLPIKQK